MQRPLASGAQRGYSDKAEAHLDLQQGISKKQLNEMKRASVQLIVPVDFHKRYPRSDMKLLELEEFVGLVRKRLA